MDAGCILLGRRTLGTPTGIIRGHPSGEGGKDGSDGDGDGDGK